MKREWQSGQNYWPRIGQRKCRLHGRWLAVSKLIAHHNQRGKLMWKKMVTNRLIPVLLQLTPGCFHSCYSEASMSHMPRAFHADREKHVKSAIQRRLCELFRAAGARPRQQVLAVLASSQPNSSKSKPARRKSSPHGIGVPSNRNIKPVKR